MGFSGVCRFVNGFSRTIIIMKLVRDAKSLKEKAIASLKIAMVTFNFNGSRPSCLTFRMRVKCC